MPTPAAARYIAAGQPRPPTPIIKAFVFLSRVWPMESYEQLLRIMMALSDLASQIQELSFVVHSAYTRRSRGGHKGDVGIRRTKIHNVGDGKTDARTIDSHRWYFESRWLTIEHARVRTGGLQFSSRLPKDADEVLRRS